MARKLTKKQKGFADDYLDSGNGTQAALKNYDVVNERSAGVIASQNLGKLSVQEYLEDKADVAASTVFEIVQFGESDQVRLSASKDILDRAGYKPVDKSIQLTKHIDVESTERSTELRDRLLGLLRR